MNRTEAVEALASIDYRPGKLEWDFLAGVGVAIEQRKAIVRNLLREGAPQSVYTVIGYENELERMEACAELVAEAVESRSAIATDSLPPADTKGPG